MIRFLTVVALSGASMALHAQTTQPAQTDTARPAAPAVEAAFKRADTNNDGKLSKEEIARLPALAERFDELDKDKDGLLSLDELKAAEQPKQ